MRTVSTNPTSNYIIGTAWKTEQYINTDLRWLILPATVWLIITCVLFLTIWRTKDKNVPIWKSSPLVLLQCMDPSNNLAWEREVRKEARISRVQLRQGENWQLVNTSTNIAEI